jgi:hypothetical protein
LQYLTTTRRALGSSAESQNKTSDFFLLSAKEIFEATRELQWAFLARIDTVDSTCDQLPRRTKAGAQTSSLMRGSSMSGLGLLGEI